MALYADAAVVELLDSSNYKDWSVLVKTYLLAQDLWDVVEEEEEYDDEEEEEEEEAEDEFKAWRKKNAMALHKIQISCGREAFSLIRNTTSAKRAWDTLAEEFKPKPDAAVVELLDSSNYVDWSVWVKTYLLAQDLWDVVEKEEEYDDEEEEEYDDEEEEEEADDKFKAWREKNAAALHKIQISCGREASSLLRNTSSAKRAWDTLAEEFNPKPDAAVVELLDSSNYVDWSVWVKTYLLDQDLWDVVEKEEEYDDDDDEEEADDKFKAWREKNATALHKIQISCGREASSRIINTSSAKHAWDTLAGYYNYNQNKPLFDAVLSGDWNEAEKFLTLHPDAIRARLPSTNDTALHKAIELENEHIVEGLVQLMSEEDLKLKENEGWTALALAAQRGNIEMVECMVRKNEKILSIPNEEDNMTPILHASLNENWDVVNYLYSVTPLQDLMPGKGPYGAGLLYNFILGMKFGSALELIERCPQLVFTQDIDGQFPMEGFVPSAFPSGTRFKFWQRWIYNCIHIERAISDIRVSVQNERNEECNRWKITWSSVVGFLQGLKSNLLELLGINRIREIKQAHNQSRELLHHMCELIKQKHGHDYLLDAIFTAVEQGMFEFIDSVLQARPDLVWRTNEMGRVPFQFAIECRQEKIYSLIYRLNKKKRKLIGNFTDESNNNALHAAGMLSPLANLDNIAGAALQMQREVQWFKEVETIVLPGDKESTNKDGMTPHKLFTKNHKELVKEGERWMKETATSCTVVGALIITIMFAAAFTIPGGNNGQTGFPIFLHKKLFMAFIVSDAISLFSSTTSVLMFLGILTSRYAEDDFLKSLPTKMIIGLSTLFISIAAMMVAFSSALFIMIHKQSWIVIPVIFLASVPITLFIWMQFPLLVEMYISTYGRGIFDRKVKSRA